MQTGATLTADGVYKAVRAYAAESRIDVYGFVVHSVRATAATSTLEHAADIAEVQEWVGDANFATIRLYDVRRSRKEDLLTFMVTY